MSRKFDVVIGSPPYQEEAQGAGTRDTPVYHEFMDAAYAIGKKAVLVTPARFLFNAGFTPKEWNQKMLADPHLTVAHYVPNSDELFPGTDIKGGIAVTYRDDSRDGEPIGTFTKFPELKTILSKVEAAGDLSIEGSMSSGRAYAYTEAMHQSNPQASTLMSEHAQFRVSSNAFEQLPFIFHEHKPDDGGDYVRVLGVIRNTRAFRWINSNFITGPESFHAYKVVVPAANGAGDFGEPLSSPLVAPPGVAVTQTFITIGAFDLESSADACLRYIKSKFARALLGVLKITQHNPASAWKHVPLQDFTEASDVDWSASGPEIDQQLCAKYGLSNAEIAIIESEVESME